MKKTGEPPEYAQVALSVLFQILGLSPRDFNEVDGLGRSIVSSMLSGGRPMSKSHIQKMSSYLRVPASWFADPAVVSSAGSQAFLDDRLTERAVVRH
jgi:antitoxin component HigA of HigAB toxin-antitoxin module